MHSWKFIHHDSDKINITGIVGVMLQSHCINVAHDKWSVCLFDKNLILMKMWVKQQQRKG